MQRNLLEALVIFLVAIAVAIVLVWPKFGDYQNIESQLAQKRTDLVNREQYFANLASAAAQLKNYGPNLQKIESALPGDPMAANLAYFLQLSASQSGLAVKGIDYSQALSGANTPAEASGGQESTLKSFEMTLSVAGDYAALKDFLQKVERSSRLIEIDSLTIAPPGVEGNQGTALNQSAGAKGANSKDPVFTYQLKLVAHYY